MARYREILGITLLTFFVLLPVLLVENIHSPYHKLVRQPNLEEKVKAYKVVNNDKIKQAERILAKPSADIRNWSQDARYKLLVTIVTVSRENRITSDLSYNPKYLSQAVAKFLEIKKLSLLHLTDFKVLICDVDPINHSELEGLINITDIIHAHYKQATQADSFEKEKLDYVQCMNHSLQYSADFILMVEDDGLPNSDLLDKLDHLFLYRLPYSRSKPGFIKLFHPSRLNGYITPDINRLLEWFAIAGLLEHMITGLLYWTSYGSTSYDYRLLRFIYFILLLLAIGRININTFRELSPFLYRLVPAPSCCVPAVIYTKDSMKAMISYLNSVHCKKGFAKDTAMEYFSQSTGLSAWLYEPKLFTHIGVYTTRRNSYVDPEFVD